MEFRLPDDPITLWRLDDARFAPTWLSGEGAFRAGGRWNVKGMHVVYTALQPATAILEVAVHKGFQVLDAVPHILTAAAVGTEARIRVVRPDEVPNSHWLRPGTLSAAQQAFGSSLLANFDLVLFPSVVVPYAWCAACSVGRGANMPRLLHQERFSLDTRLNPAR